MIAELIKTNNDETIIIKPLYGSMDVFDMWNLMYNCRFNNMTVDCANGYENAIKLHNNTWGYM